MTKVRSVIARPSIASLLLFGLASCGGDQGTPEVSTTEQPLVMTFSCPAPGFADVVVPPAPGVFPFVPLASLKTVPNPIFPPVPPVPGGVPKLRPDLGAYYIANADAAIQLGKALFWDIQAGSDNKTACATCHFQAGGDVRTRNQLNPGANGLFDGASTNYTLTAANYPFVNGPAGALTRNVDNITGSAGVRASKFKGITTAGVEQFLASTDPVFGTMRQVTGMNAPTMINAVFNHRNFGNGRAQPDFNGVNPWGNRDAAARVWAVLDAAGNVGPWKISIPNASLASQAVGPPLNPVEMSAAGRTFQDIGVKMLSLTPLASAAVPGAQKVDTTDSVLGPFSNQGGSQCVALKRPTAAGKPGLCTTYTEMIQKAFYPTWWNSAKSVKIGGKAYTLMQANFSLFWGLAIMLYEATLVSDNSPMDQYVATRFDKVTGLPIIDPVTKTIITGDVTLLDQVVERLAAEAHPITIPLATGGTRPVTRDDILAGLDLFERPIPPPGSIGLPIRTATTPGAGVGCVVCHLGAETTSASVRNLTVGIELGDAALKGAGFDLRMERMFMGIRSPAPVAPQPPPPVPLGTDTITYDNASYAVTVVNPPVTTPRVPVNTYDVGWYNVGVRPTAENVGLGGPDLAGLPLSWTEYFQTTLLDPTVIKVAGGGLGCVDAQGNPAGIPLSAPLTLPGGAPNPLAGQVLDPTTGYPILSGGLTKTEQTDVAGSFKTASLRNVEMNGPYFHTGGKATLRQVVEHYDDGGNFANPSLSPVIRPLGMTEDQLAGLVAFLVSLTDDRVRLQSAPFDHPELPVPVGQGATGADIMTTVQAVGAAGSPPVPRFLGLSPFQP